MLKGEESSGDSSRVKLGSGTEATILAKGSMYHATYRNQETFTYCNMKYATCKKQYESMQKITFAINAYTNNVWCTLHITIHIL